MQIGDYSRCDERHVHLHRKVQKYSTTTQRPTPEKQKIQKTKTKNVSLILTMTTVHSMRLRQEMGKPKGLTQITFLDSLKVMFAFKN